MSDTPDLKTVKLERPLKRAGGDITEVQIRRPMPGDLRRCKLGELMQLDVDTMIRVLPRITMPILTEAEVSNMHGADFLELASEVAAYFLTDQAKEEAGLKS